MGRSGLTGLSGSKVKPHFHASLYSSKRGSLVLFYCFEFLFKPLHPRYPIQPLYTLHPIREVSFFTRRGDLWKFFKFCKFLVIPSYCTSKIFLIPPDVSQNSSDPRPPPPPPPPPHNKRSQISFCIRS